MADKQKIVIIAGPNGAGKTTFAVDFLPNEADCPVFVNADLIAAGLASILSRSRRISGWPIDAGRDQQPRPASGEFCIRDHVERFDVLSLDSQLAGVRIFGEADLPELT